MLLLSIAQNNIAQSLRLSQALLVKKILDASNLELEDTLAIRELKNLRQQAYIQAQQIARIQNIINQLAGQLIATSNKRKPTKKPKIAAPKKYNRSQKKLRTFLTNINLYYEFNKVLTKQDKILIASTYIKRKASNQMQLYVDDYLLDVKQNRTKNKT